VSIFDIFRKKEPEPAPPIDEQAYIVLPDIAPGEVYVDRKWRDDPQTDKTVLVVGGQVHPEHLEAVKQILRGEAHVTRFPGGKVKTKRAIGGVL
jgi:hypothetical protein